ncbi:DUF2493 domain-containing protein [Asticcacaulis benevestitus]|uniref:YspA cpYpsA-related SLOG domain-containing protein n=1 Tax=Asticcacaulis benevestitus DSM 16100 = ATCC BAA-896 TaxID=1121022 RepID=V4PFV9_9CAUL|nr:DUF2493 domain-containing protein [Asticcacaulis benevestitus]ESQ87041.1 hypothetical protein ABENE_17585 [Asticcacaulis benevestitus DSM 16100 = ATCC BAA-896]
MSSYEFSDREACDLSPTELALQTMRLYRPVFTDEETDTRPFPEAHQIEGGIADMFDALDFCLVDSPMEADRNGLMWGLVNLFHRAAERLDQDLDANVVAQQSAHAHQDGSEVKATELERLIAQGQQLSARHNVLEALRERAAEQFQRATHDTWRPKAGSFVNRRHMTAALIESRDFIKARQASRLKLLAPTGTLVAFSGGIDYQDVATIWAVLDKLQAKHTDLVLLTTASISGADLIASKWAQTRQVTEVTFKPDWQRHKRAAPFKRNDILLDMLPIGVVIFPGSGVQDNLADKAKKLGIPVWRGGA